MGSTTCLALVYSKEIPGKGLGLFAARPLGKGTILGMFDGIAKQISVEDTLSCDRDYWVEVCIVNNTLFYFDMVDDTAEGVELINHACSPNCIINKFMVIETNIDVDKDEELTLDYFEITKIPLNIQCRCTPDCKTVF